jgi:hypothetical protein
MCVSFNWLRLVTNGDLLKKNNGPQNFLKSIKRFYHLRNYPSTNEKPVPIHFHLQDRIIVVYTECNIDLEHRERLASLKPKVLKRVI